MKSKFSLGTLVMLLTAAMFLACDKDGHMNPGEPGDLSEGLVVHFPFDGNSIEAISNQEYDSHGAQYVEDRFGNSNAAISLDSNYLNANVKMHDSVGTFSFWVRVENLNNIYPIFSYGGTTMGISPYRLALDGDSITLLSDRRWGTLGSDGQLEDFIIPSVIQANKWKHVVVRWSDSEELLEVFVDKKKTFSANYIDGWELWDPEEFEAPAASTIGGWMFEGGNHTGDRLRPFKGILDDVRTYNRKLSDHEIAMLFFSKDS
ncbi:LamG domain-containing protein [Olivibacter sp. SA151]|uniref:LamG domain-containing protein n=1 Tax=Olivibacter jilunii TaxID=985016 RepID=UPI003F15A120